MPVRPGTFATNAAWIAASVPAVTVSALTSTMCNTLAKELLNRDGKARMRLICHVYVVDDAACSAVPVCAMKILLSAFRLMRANNRPVGAVLNVWM